MVMKNVMMVKPLTMAAMPIAHWLMVGNAQHPAHPVIKFAETTRSMTVKIVTMVTMIRVMVAQMPVRKRMVGFVRL
jgi:hypothetical protein